MKSEMIIIDDHKIFGEGFCSLLENNNYRVKRVFQSPKKALNYLKHNLIDIVFCDINMPEINGIDLIKKIKKTNSQCKVIMISMYTERNIIKTNEEFHGLMENRKKNAEERIIDVLVSKTASQSTRESFRKKLRDGELSDNEVEIPVSGSSSLNMPTMDIPGMPGSQMGMINLGDVLGKSFLEVFNKP